MHMKEKARSEREKKEKHEHETREGGGYRKPHLASKNIVLIGLI